MTDEHLWPVIPPNYIDEFILLFSNKHKQKENSCFLKGCFKAELTQLGDGLEWEERMHIKLLPPHVCFSSCWSHMYAIN